MSQLTRDIDLTPEVSRVVAISGASISLQVNMTSSGSPMSAGTHTIQVYLTQVGAGAPPASGFNGVWVASNSLLTTFPANVTAQMLGEYGFSVWLTAIADPNERLCVMRGSLILEAA